MSTGRSRANLTRRQFVAAGVLSSAAMAIGCKGRGAQRNWDFLNEHQARTLAAICDQIIPADGFPSASQAGVLTYVDRHLARQFRRQQNAFRDGLEQADAMSRSKFGRALSDVPQAEQFEIAISLERDNRKFFDLVRKHTFEGYYGSPRHGGNRDAVSWRMLGLAEPPPLGRAQYDLKSGGRS